MPLFDIAMRYRQFAAAPHAADCYSPEARAILPQSANRNTPHITICFALEHNFTAEKTKNGEIFALCVQCFRIPRFYG